MKKEKWIFDSKWLVFYWGWNFDISYETCGYFDARHRINLNLIFFSLTVILPIWSKRTDESDAPKWGIAYHGQTLWIYRGGKGNDNGGNKWWTMYMPWQPTHIRHSRLKADGVSWEHELKGESKNFWEDAWKDVLWHRTVPYKYFLRSGEIQNVMATIGVSEREWRWYWFQWLPLTKSIHKEITVDFSEEVGEERGSWKGGVTGCGYTLLPNETPEECIKRMELNRKF